MTDGGAIVGLATTQKESVAEGGCPASGARGGQFDVLCILGVGDDIFDVRNDVATSRGEEFCTDFEVGFGPFFDVAIPFFKREILDHCGVGERRFLHHCTRQFDGIEHGDGGNGGAFADLPNHLAKRRFLLHAWEFKGDSASRVMLGVPHFFLLSIVVDFEDESVGVEVPASALFGHFLAEGLDLCDHRSVFGIIAANDAEFRRDKAEFLKRLEFLDVGFEGEFDGFVGEETQVIGGGFAGVFLFESAHCQISRANFIAIKSVERVERHIDFAAHLEIWNVDVRGNGRDIAHIVGDIFSDAPVPARRGDAEIAVFVVGDAARESVDFGGGDDIAWKILKPVRDFLKNAVDIGFMDGEHGNVVDDFATRSHLGRIHFGDHGVFWGEMAHALHEVIERQIADDGLTARIEVVVLADFGGEGVDGHGGDRVEELLVGGSRRVWHFVRSSCGFVHIVVVLGIGEQGSLRIFRGYFLFRHGMNSWLVG